MSTTRSSLAGGETFTRRGFMARCRLSRFGEGNIYPHEETMAGPKQDRLLLTRACKANLSQIFGLYPDPAERGPGTAGAGHGRRTPAGGDRSPGRRSPPVAGHRSGDHSPGRSRIMGPKPVFIADGHHRYETACNYRDELAGQRADSSPIIRPTTC